MEAIIAAIITSVATLMKGSGFSRLLSWLSQATAKLLPGRGKGFHWGNFDIKPIPPKHQPLSPVQLEQRSKETAFPQYGVRLIPRIDFREDGLLGKQERKYVFIGDYEEQRNRTVQQILENLWAGAYDDVPPGDWIAVVFPIGEIWGQRGRLDCKPATWKSIFRYLSDPERLGLFIPSEEEKLKMGKLPRDYRSDDQQYWYEQLVTGKRGPIGTLGFDFDIPSLFGLNTGCFSGTGLSYSWSRLFLVKNAPIKELSYRIQELGSISSKIHLNAEVIDDGHK